MRRRFWLRRLSLLSFLFLFVSPTFAERGVFISNSGTCADVPSPEKFVTYCLPSVGANVHNLLVWDGAGWIVSITGAGTGSVTTFSAGNLSPLFTTSVANPSTTPALTFALSNFTAHQFLGNATGGTTTPTAVQPNFTDLAGTATKAQLPATTVFTDQSNVYTGTFTQDMSANTQTLRIPLKATPGSPATGEIYVDTPDLKWRDPTGPTTQVALRANDATIVKTNQANTFTAGPQRFGNTFQLDVSAPAQITGNQNPYTLPTKTWVRLSSNGTYNITCLDATSRTYDLVFLVNINTVGNFILQHQNGGCAVAANRIISQTGTDMTSQPGDVVMAVYDNTDSRWRISKVGISPTTGCAAGRAPTGVDSSANSVACTNYLEEPAGTGFAVKTASDVSTARSMATASASRITISNVDGLGGNPTWDVGPSTIDGSLYGCSPSGASGTTYACNLTIAPAGYVTHGIYHFKADVASAAGPVTINFNSLGAKTIKKSVSTDLAANDLLAGQMVFVMYDGTNMQLISGSGGGGSVCGSNKYVQFNDAGACGATTDLQFDKSTKILSVGTGIVVGAGPYAIFDASAVASSDKTLTIRNLSGTIALTSDLAFTSITGTATTAQLPAASNFRLCEIVVGDPGAGSSALANDNDTPVVCANKTGATLTITAVECYADAGSPTVTPIITGGGATSILTGALTCGTGSFASGTLNGTPTQSNNGTIDANITTAGGTAKYIVMRITRTL